MTTTDHTAPPTDAAGILQAATALAPQIEAAAAEIETGRTLPPAIVAAMQAAGVFRMAMPRAWGGPELDPLAQIRVIEAVARIDGAAGWCAMIGCDGGFVGARLDDTVARAMWPDLDAPTALVTQPRGQAVPVPGGYRVSGRWPFASGCRHSAWFSSACVTQQDGAPVLGPDGRPAVRFCVIPAAEVEIIDTWRATGVRGSGSHDYAVHDAFVPAEHTYLRSDPCRRPEPLYRWPLTYILKLSGVPLGIAQHAIDFLSDLAAHKTNFRGGSNLREEVYAQIAVAEAEALVGAARAYVAETVTALWDEVCAGNQPSPAVIARARLAMAHAFRSCVAAVDRCYESGGSASLYEPSPLDRCLRDIHTINQHAMVSGKTYESAGRFLFGLDPRDPTF